MSADWLLPHLNRAPIEDAYRNAAGKEIDSGKILSPVSSSALVANAFGYFQGDQNQIPRIPSLEIKHWTRPSVRLEASLPFPWRGGRRPWLDVLIETDHDLVGIESKRYEPFRAAHTPHFAPAYDRANVWDQQVSLYDSLRSELNAGAGGWEALDLAQLVKHALGLSVLSRNRGKPATLVYLYCEPKMWADSGLPVAVDAIERHANAVRRLVERLAGSGVGFHALTYSTLLRTWLVQGEPGLQAHALAVANSFQIDR